MAGATVTVTDEGRVPDSTEELLRGVAAGSRQSFDDLHRRTRARVRSAAEGILRDPSHAEEIVQEVFLEVWRTADRFDGARGSGISWMLTMTRRRAIDRVRATQASRDRDHRIGMRDRDDATDSVAAAGETRIEGARARRTLDRLTAVQRRAIELTYLEGYGLAEVAALTGVPRTTAKTRIRAGLIRMRSELEA